MTDIYRHKHPELRQFTFSKKQTKNYTKARLDYFLINDDSLDLVKKVGIGKETTLSDHRPIYLHISLSKVQKGRGFWGLNGDFLTEPEYVFGVNNVIERVISQYSEQQNFDASPKQPNQRPSSRPLLISHILLHDVLLLEIRAFSLKYAAEEKKKMLRRTKEHNDLIEQRQNSIEQEDLEEVEVLNREVPELEDEREMALARKQ